LDCSTIIFPHPVVFAGSARWWRLFAVRLGAWWAAAASIAVADALLDERRELTGLPRLTRCLVNP
jgi:hypothetical protein